MELFFLLVLIVLMVVALGAGYPVAFALPGSAIITIALAALAGYLFDGRVEAYFAHGDPIQWLNAGVTNLRGIYWEAERDTLIAIPLFIFMGIMLERSKIAEDLLVTMGQLFGPIPGGVGISVVVVGALLAATTGIVGATVIAMGLISLPVMLRANYSHSLATGTISASGTLGQIIPPSIVLIILADQLSNATDQGSAIRTADYKAGTGSSTLPTEFDLTSTSAGDMFLGAFLPGLVLVGLYILYILVLALIRPKMAPPAPFEGKMDMKFALRVLVVLMPPLTLIFVVLGSIILGIATVNQAGAIGAIGAMIMAGYRLMEGKKGAFTPAILAVASVAALTVLLNLYDINIKATHDSGDLVVIALASVASLVFMFAVAWSGWRTYKLDDTLNGVMIETAKTTSLVFIILLGAAMLTAAFRAFGGEELVRDFLSGLPGGFISKFVVVMTVIFLLGFFLDFIEIAVVVVPIIAPILLADPTANVTAVWLGVMIGVNMQTSFLTPPFGFALFYLRGVAPPIVKTIQMYKGVVPFILLQLLGLAIVGFFPGLVNYLPNKVYLTSETAPPPKNPRLQACLDVYLFAEYDRRGDALRASIETAKKLDISYLPKNYQQTLTEGFAAASATFGLVDTVRKAEGAVTAFIPGYQPMHREMRDLRVETGAIDRKLAKLTKDRQQIPDDRADAEQRRQKIDAEVAALNEQKEAFKARIPDGWDEARKTYLKLRKDEKQARRKYHRSVDDAYDPIPTLRKVIAHTGALKALEADIKGLAEVIAKAPGPEAMEKIKAVENAVGKVAGTRKIKSRLSKARRLMKGDKPKRERAAKEQIAAMKLFAEDMAWRTKAAENLAGGLATYDIAIRDTIGLRLQERLSEEQAEVVATCQSIHRDISLDF
ncbi:MAG: TRAP transporter large permease subunit [Magnetovibrio sp.]|nr:TRAP transporter large permease subunit [Magnetovibrio sp.]